MKNQITGIMDIDSKLCNRKCDEQGLPIFFTIIGKSGEYRTQMALQLGRKLINYDPRSNIVHFDFIGDTSLNYAREILNTQDENAYMNISYNNTDFNHISFMIEKMVEDKEKKYTKDNMPVSLIIFDQPEIILHSQDDMVKLKNINKYDIMQKNLFELRGRGNLIFISILTIKSMIGSFTNSSPSQYLKPTETMTKSTMTLYYSCLIIKTEFIKSINKLKMQIISVTTIKSRFNSLGRTTDIPAYDGIIGSCQKGFHLANNGKIYTRNKRTRIRRFFR